MATTKTPFGTLTDGFLGEDTDSNATGFIDVADGDIDALHLVQIDNTGAGTPTEVWTKFYNSTAPTIGTTDPVMVLVTPANVKRAWHVLTDATSKGLEGIFSTGLSYVTVKDGGGTAGTTDPDTTVQVRLIYTKA